MFPAPAPEHRARALSASSGPGCCAERYHEKNIDTTPVRESTQKTRNTTQLDTYFMLKSQEKHVDPAHTTHAKSYDETPLFRCGGQRTYPPRKSTHHDSPPQREISRLFPFCSERSSRLLLKHGQGELVQENVARQRRVDFWVHVRPLQHLRRNSTWKSFTGA